jgi:hypothetical protein
VATSTGTARTAAKWRSDDEVWLDHVTLVEADLEWLAPVRMLTMWAVKMPPGFLARLPQLGFVDYRGGSGSDLSFLDGCTDLRGLVVNQVRGVDDLSGLTRLVCLQQLDLYGLPRVREIPSLGAHRHLRRAWMGSMKGLVGLTGLLDAPGLEELHLSRAVGLAPDDADRISTHPTITKFGWFAEDVPVATWKPVCDRITKPSPSLMRPEEWFRANDKTSSFADS